MAPRPRPRPLDEVLANASHPQCVGPPSDLPQGEELPHTTLCCPDQSSARSPVRPASLCCIARLWASPPGDFGVGVSRPRGREVGRHLVLPPYICPCLTLVPSAWTASCSSHLDQAVQPKTSLLFYVHRVRSRGFNTPGHTEEGEPGADPRQALPSSSTRCP